MSRLLTGISTLCGDSAAKRLRYTFDLYDHNKDGYITQAEMEEYLRTVYMVSAAAAPASCQHSITQLKISLYRSPFKPFHRNLLGNKQRRLSLAKVTAEDAFRRVSGCCFIFCLSGHASASSLHGVVAPQADTNRDGRLSFEEFRQWLSTAGSGDVAADVVGSIKSKKAMASSLQQLQESTLLSKVSYSEILRDLLSVGANEESDVGVAGARAVTSHWPGAASRCRGAAQCEALV